MDGSRSGAATESKDPFPLTPFSVPQGVFHHYPHTAAVSLLLQLPDSSVMSLMNHRALRTLIALAPKRRAESHSDGDSDAQPDRNVPGQYSESRAQRRSHRYPQTCVF